MARACVIVLDAVGAGELPDAADYGDEGSNTLGGKLTYEAVAEAHGLPYTALADAERALV